MLIHLSMQNYAIVEHLDLELKNGMSVISGETGAGKSIMLDALSLTLGARADSGVVRPGCDKADILSSFDISQIPEASEWLKQRDLDNNGQCLLRRVITAEGRSRAYINGTPCTQNNLKELGAMLIDIHSQHEHQSLLKTETHRRLLDEYAGLAQLAQNAFALAKQWREQHTELKRLSEQSDEQQARVQLLTYQLEELDALALGETELQELEQEQQTLAQSGKLIDHCRTIIEMCSESDNNLLSTLGGIAHRSKQLQAPPAAITQADEMLVSAHIQIEEAVSELTRFLDGFDADPERQIYVEERLDSIYSLARKHRVQPETLCELRSQIAAELEQLNTSDEQLEALALGLESSLNAYLTCAKTLSTERSKAARKLSRAVTERMQELGMPGGCFEVILKPLSTEEPNPFGQETVEFMVSANPGQPLKNLAKVASGGELSRISLAIQVITAQTSRVPTLVFDEVDVGIGGPTAEIVGQLLRQLGAHGQVITVTHLPQVAAQGHQHLFVYKHRGKNVTSTAIKELSDSERTEEIARMLGGIDLTRESLAHAEQMLTRKIA